MPRTSPATCRSAQMGCLDLIWRRTWRRSTKRDPATTFLLFVMSMGASLLPFRGDSASWSPDGRGRQQKRSTSARSWIPVATTGSASAWTASPVRYRLRWPDPMRRPSRSTRCSESSSTTPCGLYHSSFSPRWPSEFWRFAAASSRSAMCPKWRPRSGRTGCRCACPTRISRVRSRPW